MDIDEKKQKENEARVAEEYLSSLSDLNCNSKPLINMLTMLADENINYAPVIVNVVQNHIAKVTIIFKRIFSKLIKQAATTAFIDIFKIWYNNYVC